MTAHDDHGLGKMAYLLLLINGLWTFVGLYLAQALFYQTITVILFTFFLIFFSYKLKNFGIYLCHMFFFFLLMWFDYDFIGSLNQKLGGLPLKDQFFAQFDQWLFGMPVASFHQSLFDFSPTFHRLVNDSLMISYVFYYLFPFFGVLAVCYLGKSEQKKYLGAFTLSVMIFLSISYLLYVLVPVTGPQYYLEYFRYTPLPFGNAGRSIHQLISGLHPNLIDCFPSVHAGMAILTTSWLYILSIRGRALFFAVTLMIIWSTLALRFHYTLDVMGSILLVPLSLVLSLKLIKYFDFQL